MLRLITVVLVLIFSLPMAHAAAPMEKAAERGDVKALQEQLSAGADINQRFDLGRSALMIAARHGHRPAVSALADAGANLDLQDNNGDTALHLAAAYTHRPVVELLLKLGASTQLRNKSDYTVLGYMQRLSLDSGSDQLLRSMTDYLAKTIPKLPQTRAKVAGTKIGEPALFVEYVLFNVEKYRATPDNLQKAAKTALKNRDWTIMKSEPQRFIGTFTRKEIEYRVEIIFLPNNVVRIAFLNGYHDTRPNYLRNLEKEMVTELKLLSARQ